MLVILTTHPIQYQVPLWQRLAASGRIDFEVWYMSDHAVRPSLDREFGRVFAWDLDLLSGYPYRFLGARRHDISSFFGARLPDFSSALRAAGAAALLVNGWQTAAYWDAVFAARQAGLPVWVRGESNDLHRTPLWKRGVKTLVLRQLFKRIDHFLTIGTANARLYQRYGIGRNRLHDAPYAVDNDRFAAHANELSARRATIRQEWRIPRDVFCVLFAGKLIPKKRPHDLIDAATLLANSAATQPSPSPGRPVHLLFAGDGELWSSLEARCDVRFSARTPAQRDSAPRGSPAASFAGFLNQREIARAYAAADCLVLPSDFRETWGLVVNEAMASGLPCIASDACGCAEDMVAPLDGALVFREGDSADLARAIEHLMHNPPAPQRLAAQVHRFSFARTVDTIAALASASPGMTVRGNASDARQSPAVKTFGSHA